MLKVRIRCPQSMGGGIDEMIPDTLEDDFKFEDLDASERRNDNDQVD